MKDTCRCSPIVRHKLLQWAWKWACTSADPWGGASVPRGAWDGLGLCLNSSWEMQGANLFSSAGLSVGQVIALQFSGGSCWGIAQTLGKHGGLKTPQREFCLGPAGELEAVLSKPKLMIQPEHLRGQPFLLHTAKAPPTPSQAAELQSGFLLGRHNSLLLSPSLTVLSTVCFPLWHRKTV